MKNKLFLFLILFFSSANIFAQIISGYVFEDKNGNGIKDFSESGIENVAVSNQFIVVKTNSEGFYEIRNTKSYGLIFVSLPTGFFSKSWWSNISENETIYNFPLSKLETKNNFTFIHASDTHISEKSRNRTEKLREIVNNLKPDFVLITGDLVQDALRVPENEATGYYNLYLSEIQKFTAPVWSVPGNHEIFGIERHLSKVETGNPLYGKKMYHHFLGPNYYSFNFGGFHFVGIDAVAFEDLWYFGYVDSIQLEWLKQDLAFIPANMPVITFNHIPFWSGSLSMSNFNESANPTRTLEKVNGVPQFRHVVSNANEILNILRTHKFPMALGGHNHSRQVFWLETDEQQTRFEQAAAVVGSGGKIGNINFPSGVTFYSVKNNEVSEGKFIKLD